MPLKGILPALVTPFSGDGRLDLQSTRRLVRYVLDAGVHGVFVAGSQGEFYALDDDERMRLAEAVVDEVAGRVPVCVGTGAITTEQTIRCTRRVAETGADAVSIITPFYIKPSASELVDHFRAIAESTDLPVLLYNNPARTGVCISPEVVRRLSPVDGIVGMKDSSGDLTLLSEYLTAGRPGFSVLVGRDSLIHAALIAGAHGAVASTANVAPGLVVEIYEAAIAGDHSRARAAQLRLNPLRKAFELGTFPVVIKEALNLLGMDVGTARAPVSALDEVRRVELAQILMEMGFEKAGYMRDVMR